MTGGREKAKAAQMREVIQQLTASGNVCDQRKGRDLDELLSLSAAGWHGRFSMEGFLSGPRRMLLAVCTLTGLRGFIWEGRPSFAESFRFVLGMTPDYPLSMPGIKFLEPLPYSPHVVHPSFLPEDLNGLPGELQTYFREGKGNMCYLRSDQWSPVNDTLAIACWEASRILSGRFHAEAGSLNQSARDFMLRGEAAGSLGPPLPYPRLQAGAQERNAAFDGGDAPVAETIECGSVDWLDGDEQEAASDGS